jgi:hypothetical protein
LGRVQRQRPFVSPGFVSNAGVHSNVARHFPRGLGPMRHAWPSQAQPQIHFWLGRS